MQKEIITPDKAFDVYKRHSELEFEDNSLEIHNFDSHSNTYYNLNTPLHLILMYNTCGLPNVTDNFLSISPSGSPN